MIDFSTISFSVTPPLPPGTASSSRESSGYNGLPPDNSDKSKPSSDKVRTPGIAEAQDLNLAEIRELTKLKHRDREVKAHEQAHIAAGGAYVKSGAHYEYQEGPDGRKYAVGGEVQIDTSKVSGDPEATARKMQAIRSAAMAPASPSGQDRNVAAKATRTENRMRLEILLRRYEEASSVEGGRPGTTPEDSDATADPGHPTSPGSRINITG